MRMFTIVLSVALMVLTFVSCKKEPAAMKFKNLKCCDSITGTTRRNADTALATGAKSYDELFTDCQNNITKKRGIYCAATLPGKLGSSKVTLQVITAIYGGVAYSRTMDADPDMTSLEAVYNLESKDSYIIQFVVNDKIIARGPITYQ